MAILVGVAVAGVYSDVDVTEDAQRSQDTQLRQVGYLISKLDAVLTSPITPSQS